jgi:hypothetical protein
MESYLFIIQFIVEFKYTIILVINHHSIYIKINNLLRYNNIDDIIQRQNKEH